MRNRGRITLSSLLTLAVIGYLLFVGYTYGDIWLTSLKLKKFVKEISAGAYDKSDQQLIDMIIEQADKFGIELYEDDIEITRKGDFIYITIYYEIERNMLFWTLHKEIEISTRSPLSPVI